MALKELVLTKLEGRLAALNVHVTRVEDTFNVALGQGPLAHRANVDPAALVARLEGTAAEQDEWTLDRLVAGYASGVQHVLLEPARSKASEWSFIESAGGLMPNIEVDTFCLGAEAASGEAPWVQPFLGDMVVSYLVHLTRGLRVLSAPQVERWGTTADRVTSGARSMLFHRTRELRFVPHEGFTHVQALHGGDGYDAVRATVVADVFFGDTDSTTRIAMPTQDLLLIVFKGTDEAVAELREATAQAVQKASYPLSDQIFAFKSSKPVPVDA